MSKHQIIYTSSKRGIDTVNDGQHVHSYDEAFKGKISDGVRSLFTYQVPNVTMTDDIVSEMPQAFLYRRLPDGSCAVALNTYLGRDYMGQAGRFGNHLSHAVICNEQDFNVYPCELYGSDLLRDHMSFDEVNSAEQPPYLAEPEIAKGYSVSIESVSEFLSFENRMENYKKMLAAMLSFETARKRVVICDSAENIIMWIAALQYALPLELALNVNFTSYEFNPELSVSQICGVITESTGYNVSKASVHYTFDFFNNIISDIKTDGDFFDFIDMGMSMSFDSIQAFHEFTRAKLTYRIPNEQYYDVYSLYCLFSDGFNSASQIIFNKAIAIAETFATENAKDELACKLVEERKFILSAADDYAMKVLKFLLSRMKTVSNNIQEAIRTLVVEKAIGSFMSASANEDSFLRMYKEVETLATENNIIIPYEFMKGSNKEKLLSVMSRSSEQWRWNFVLDVLCDYVIVQNLSAEQLSSKFEMGQLIVNLIRSRTSTDTESGLALITRAIDKFADNWIYFISLTLNVENILSGLPDSSQIKSSVWKYVLRIITQRQAENKRDITDFFLKNNMPERVFDVYKAFMEMASNQKIAYELFQEQLTITNGSYVKSFNLRIYERYYAYLANSTESNSVKAKKELLQLIITRGIAPAFSDELIKSVLSGVPMENPSRDNSEIIESILTYYKKQNITGRLLLLASGMAFNKIKNKIDLVNAIKSVHALTDGVAINLTGIQAADSEKYIGWIVPKIYDCCGTAKDLVTCYKQFRHTETSSRWFITICAKEAFKEGKGDKEFGSILMFLEFLFDVGSAEDRKDAGEILYKLNKQKLENLDVVVKKTFKGKPQQLANWNEIREAATKTNPLLRFFKRK